jgi:hypothetical protein
MKHEKVIHSTLKQVNWEFVLSTYQTLREERVRKTDLVEEVKLLLENVVLKKKEQLIHDMWTINAVWGEENFCLELIFTPIIVFVDTYEKKTVKNNKIQRLEERLRLALEIEAYEQAEKIQKSLNKLRAQVE